MNKIKFYDDWSESEKVFYEMCKLLNVPIQYEPQTVEIIPPFNGTNGYVKATTYTPDFYIKINNELIVIEVKGFARPRDYIIAKLADKFFVEQAGVKFYMITLKGTEKQSNRDWYLYHQKGVAKRGLKARTFWEYMGIKEDTHQVYLQAKANIKKGVQSE